MNATTIYYSTYFRYSWEVVGPNFTLAQVVICLWTKVLSLSISDWDFFFCLLLSSPCLLWRLTFRMRTHPCTPARTGWESLFVRQRRAMTRWSRTNLPAAGSWLAFSVLQVHFDPIPQPSLWKRKIRHTHTIATLMARLFSFSPWIVFSCRRRRRCCCCCFVHTTIGIVVVTDCSFRPCHHPPNECRAQRWQQQQQQKQLKFLRFEHDRFIFLCYILLSCNIINRCYLSCRKASFVKLSIFFSLVVGVVVVPAGHMPKTLLPFMSTEEEKKKIV